jgi:hypothetical protein
VDERVVCPLGKGRGDIAFTRDCRSIFVLPWAPGDAGWVAGWYDPFSGTLIEPLNMSDDGLIDPKDHERIRQEGNADRLLASYLARRNWPKDTAGRIRLGRDGMGESTWTVTDDGSRLLSAVGGNQLAVFDTVTGREMANFRVGGVVGSLAVSPDDSVLFVGFAAGGEFWHAD